MRINCSKIMLAEITEVPPNAFFVCSRSCQNFFHKPERLPVQTAIRRMRNLLCGTAVKVGDTVDIMHDNSAGRCVEACVGTVVALQYIWKQRCAQFTVKPLLGGRDVKVWPGALQLRLVENDEALRTRPHLQGRSRGLKAQGHPNVLLDRVDSAWVRAAQNNVVVVIDDLLRLWIAFQVL